MFHFHIPELVSFKISDSCNLSHFFLKKKISVQISFVCLIPLVQTGLGHSLLKFWFLVILGLDYFVKQDCSCCTLIADKFAQFSPEILAGKGFSRLLVFITCDNYF